MHCQFKNSSLSLPKGIFPSIGWQKGGDKVVGGAYDVITSKTLCGKFAIEN